MMKQIKRYFIAGILIILPLFITGYILVVFVKFADGILGKFINNYLRQILGFYIPGLGLILFLAFIFVTGFLTAHFLGKRFYLLIDKMLRRFPVVGYIYPAIKQITEFLFASKRPAFKKVVLIEYPRRGLWSIGFSTNEGFQEAVEKTGRDLLSVFIPSSPGPLTGFFILIPPQEAIFLDMAVEDAIKLVVSGGLLNPASPEGVEKQ